MLYALCSLLWEMAQHRLEKCVWSPEKGRAIQRLSGGDIPTPGEWPSLPGQAVVTGAHSGTIERLGE